MSADNDEIIDAVAAGLTKPKRARTEAGEVEHHDLEETVEAAKFLQRQNATSGSPFGCLRHAQAQPPGGCG